MRILVRVSVEQEPIVIHDEARNLSESQMKRLIEQAMFKPGWKLILLNNIQDKQLHAELSEAIDDIVNGTPTDTQGCCKG